MAAREIVAQNEIEWPSNSSSKGTPREAAPKRDRIAEMLVLTAEVMGTELSAPALEVFVSHLLKYSTEEIWAALVRCQSEIRGKNGFPPILALPDILDRRGVVSEARTGEAEGMAAWDLVMSHADKWIVSDPYGNYGIKRYFEEPSRSPELPPRITDTVRRVGGWRTIKTMTDEDFPFVQKRFFEAYREWDATELAAQQLLRTPEFAQLAAKVAMPQLTKGDGIPRSKETQGGPHRSANTPAYRILDCHSESEIKIQSRSSK